MEEQKEKRTEKERKKKGGENKKTQLQLPIILIDMKVVRARGKINPCFFSLLFLFSPFL